MYEAGPSCHGISPKRPRSESHPFDVLKEWRIALLGKFCVRPLAELRNALMECAAKVEDSVSSLTTHLVIGSDEFDKTTAEVEKLNLQFRELPVIGEGVVWGILNGDLDDVYIPSKRTRRRSVGTPQPTKATTSKPDEPETKDDEPKSMEDLVLEAVKKLHDDGEEVVSSAQVEVILSDKCEDTFLEDNWDEVLQKALDSCVEKETLAKMGFLYMLKDGNDPEIDSTALAASDSLSCANSPAVFRTERDDDGTGSNVANKDEQEGLRYIKEISSSGNLKCFACEKMINKGEVAIHLMDRTVKSVLETSMESQGLVHGREVGSRWVVVEEVIVHEVCIENAEEICLARRTKQSIVPKLTKRRNLKQLDRNNSSPQVKPETAFQPNRKRQADADDDHLSNLELPGLTPPRPLLSRTPRNSSSGPRTLSLGTRRPRPNAPVHSVRKTTEPRGTPNLLSTSRSREPVQYKNGEKPQIASTATAFRSGNHSRRLPENSSRPSGSSSDALNVPRTVQQATLPKPEPEPEIEGDWLGLKQVSRKSSKGRSRCSHCGKTIEEGDAEVRMKDYSLYQMVKTGTKHWRAKRLRKAPKAQINMLSLHEDCAEEAEEKYEKKFEKEWRKIAHLFVEADEDADE